MVNVHHLELFYYVAKHRGIGVAARHMPYGIQQPAISSQMIELERSLDTVLFQRRPFALTPAGRDLFEFVLPFFSNLDAVATALSGRSRPVLRLAATPTIIRQHLPPVLHELRRAFPEMKVAIREIEPAQAEPLLRASEVDVAVSLFQQGPPSGLKVKVLGEFRLAIAVRAEEPFESGLDAIRDAMARGIGLISLPQSSASAKCFQDELTRRGWKWPQEIEVNSLDLIYEYVAAGFGRGMTVEIPAAAPHRQVRLLPLASFPAVPVALLWQGRLAPVAEAFVEAMGRYVEALNLPAVERGKTRGRRGPRSKR